MLPTCTRKHWLLVIVSQPGVNQGKSSHVHIVGSKKNVVPEVEIIENVRKFLCREYQSRYKVEVNFNDIFLPAAMVETPQQDNLNDCELHTLENMYRCRLDEPWDAVDLLTNWCTSQDAQIRLAHDISVLAKANGYREVRQQIARVARMSVPDTTSHGVTKDITAYGTLTSPTSETAYQTPDEEGVCLGFLIPVDLDKNSDDSDEIIEESPPIDERKLLPP
ncbi:hypothetical protein GQX74_005946 [Glossina fuscipes]|nr:hypothetical protein GQX74_005946 [Glossina fuscipes]